MREDERTFERPRGQAWGNEAQRSVLHAIAEDVARRSGHRVAAIEVLRSDGNLEFVAIVGSPEGSERLIGQASPLSIEKIVAFGTRIDGWVHVRAEDVDAQTRAWMLQYGHTPDLPEPDSPDGWHPEDRLVRLLTNDNGDLRGLLYLDEPVSGRRPDAETIAAINAEIGTMYDGVVSMVESELYGGQVRMLTKARLAMARVSPDTDLDAFVRHTCDALAGSVAVDSVDVLLAGQESPALEPHTADLEHHMRDVWRSRGHLILERDVAWGTGGLRVPTPAIMRRAMERRGLGSWLLIPLGRGREYLGTMGLGRAPGSERWSDAEVHAAVVLGWEVASSIVSFRLMESERRLNAELRDIDDYRRDMVVTLAHELRNPVSVLFTHLEILEQDTSPTSVLESRSAMERAARRIEDMTEDLMALARVSDPERAATVAPVDLSAVVRESSQFLAEVAARGGVDLVTDVAPDQVVLGEDSSIQQLAANLVSNAVKYTPAGGHVTVTLEPTDGDDGRPGVRLTCADDGIGIGEDDLEHVFTPFFRSGNPQARERPGTGLGLSIIERVVKWHGGTVEVTSELGAGTTFVVWLPAPASVP